MVDRFLSNPISVMIAAAVVAGLVWWWYHLDQRNDPHARKPNTRRHGRHDDG
jgi:hypothetical protein